ncbi:hypothetical protein [Sinorhizobium meliloti]|uniref:hypothetical protein n=1 Tax=Rhizobium meliloti TaxID=382 RepID=UPI000FDB03EE|nr:hypothetical protein [Sinorhizobium meliloti]RVO31927.1 hypothetical protein CN095_21105 [Sinorhizobium meliloti]
MPKKMKNTSAESFLKAAIGHHEAMALIFPKVGNTSVPDNAVFFAFYNVFGFAVELYLKSFLAADRLTVEQLSKAPYSHNLENLFAEADKRGLFDFPGRPDVEKSALKKIVEIIGPRFADYTYRYLDDDDNVYQYIESMEYVWPVMDDLRIRIEASGVTADNTP